MHNLDLVRLKQLPLDDLQPLLQESRAQGFDFLDWLVDDYLNDRNRFARVGEALFGAYAEQGMIAVGGLNRDPYVQAEDTGRVRRVYVLADWRRQGVGRQLMARIIDEARIHFRLLTLRTPSEQASRFYCALGFQTQPQVRGATHHLILTAD